MSNVTFFIQGCPTCGRRLQIRVEYLGRRMMCQHCHGQFVATDSTSTRCECVGYEHPLLRRAEELLESVALRRHQSRASRPR